MTVKFTSQGSMVQVSMAAALQTLATETAALSAAAESNDDSAERFFFRNFTVKIGVQGTARVAAEEVWLLLVPYLGSVQGSLEGTIDDTSLADAYIATDKDGNKVKWKLDADTAARNLTWANVSIPNSDYYIGVYNGTSYAFAGTNEVWASSAFSVENVT